MTVIDTELSRRSWYYLYLVDAYQQAVALNSGDVVAQQELEATRFYLIEPTVPDLY